ncbi:MAG: hypothetical protein ABI240_13830 [Sphingomonas sp.]
MVISDAQRDLRRAYVGGGPGVLVSASIWFAAAFVQRAHGVGTGFAVLFLGGMMIFPVSKLLCRIAFRRENESSANPLGMTALESTVAMIGGLFAAWLFLPSQPMLVFPLAAIAVGTHYAVFKTIYGDRSFWILGAVVTAIGLADIFASELRGSTTILVAVAELAFGLPLTVRAVRAKNSAASGTIN